MSNHEENERKVALRILVGKGVKSHLAAVNLNKGWAQVSVHLGTG
jgi:hypothetical protein